MVGMKSALFSLVFIGLLVAGANAAPLSVTIEDHDFTFDVPLSAVYDFLGASPDHLYVPFEADKHYAHGYTYTGVLPTVPGGPPAGADPYPLYSGSPIQFAGNLGLDMYFTANDGPYTNPGGDTFEVSLTGTQGGLKITGFVATQGWPPAALYPPGATTEITLLEIEFTRVSLLARAGNDTADLIEGIGIIKTLLGESPAQLGLPSDGAAFFKFIAPGGASIFPSLAASVYDPLVDYGLAPIYGSRVSGETGALPEPGALAMIALGGLALLRRRARAA